MIGNVIRFPLLLVLLTIIAYSACGTGPSISQININLSVSTNLTLLSDIIDITIFKIPYLSDRRGPDLANHNVSEKPDDTKKNNQPVFWSRNVDGITHTYQVVIAQGTTWNQARDAAIAKGGHLATITNKDENDFVFSYIQNASYWSPCRGNIFGPWLGGYQPIGFNNNGSGWIWVTGEKWEYTNWHPKEPNDFMGEEDKLFYYVNNCTPSPTWGDHRNDGDGNAVYIIEWEKPVYLNYIKISHNTHWEYSEKIHR